MGFFENEEKELVKEILRGSNNAFKKLINDNKRIVGSIVFKMLSSSEDREDIAQDIFIKVYTNLKTFKFESKLSTWIARISYTTCINHLKKNKPDLLDDVKKYDDFEEDISEAEKIEDTIFQLPDEIVSDSQRKIILDEEINSLPILWKTLLTLYHSEEMKYDEISKITGLPIGTVKSYLYRARNTLRKNLISKFQKEDIL